MKRRRTMIALGVAALAIAVAGLVLACRRHVLQEYEATAELTPVCRCGAKSVGAYGACARKALAQFEQIKDAVCEGKCEVSFVPGLRDGVIRVLATAASAQMAAQTANEHALAAARRLDEARADSARQGARQLSEIADRARRRLRAAERKVASACASGAAQTALAEECRGLSNVCARAESDLAKMMELVGRQCDGGVLELSRCAKDEDAVAVLVLFGKWRMRLP